eukprot:11165159-Lingulodinium_polyedra.AAC.1
MPSKKRVEEEGSEGFSATAKVMLVRRLQRDWVKSRRRQAGAAAVSTEAGPAQAVGGARPDSDR